MKTKHIIYLSFAIWLILLILFLVFEKLSIWWFVIGVLPVGISHYYLYKRFLQSTNEFEQINSTLEQLVVGERESRIIPLNGRGNHLVHANITRLAKQIEKLLIKKHEDEQTIQLLTDNIESPIIYIDLDGRTRYFNQQFLRKFNTRLQTNDIYELIPVKSVYEFIDTSFIEEINLTRTLEVNERYFSAASRIILDNDNTFMGVLCIFNDITELKRFEKMQREFLADASHELKTPLSAIKGATEILLDRPYDPNIHREFIEMIQMENERMEKIVQDILLISKVEREIGLTIERVYLNHLILDIVDSLSIRLTQKDQTVQVELTDDLYISGDKERLRQAFLNLIVNAMNYTDKGRTITINGYQTKETIVIEFTDQGMGISEEDIPHIFKRFYRVDKARSRETGGTGLGLPIVKSVMDAHQATIDVKSEVNIGTTFIITFLINN